jgi:hypothetical protein
LREDAQIGRKPQTLLKVAGDRLMSARDIAGRLERKAAK